MINDTEFQYIRDSHPRHSPLRFKHTVTFAECIGRIMSNVCKVACGDYYDLHILDTQPVA